MNTIKIQTKAKVGDTIYYFKGPYFGDFKIVKDEVEAIFLKRSFALKEIYYKCKKAKGKEEEDIFMTMQEAKKGQAKQIERCKQEEEKEEEKKAKEALEDYKKYVEPHLKK